MTFRDFMKGHTSCEIRCLYRGDVVRRLTVNGDTLHLDAISEAIDLPLTTAIVYEAWTFDRGSLLFALPGAPLLKLCTEFDRIVFDDGTEVSATHLRA